MGALINVFRKLFDDTTTNNTLLSALASADRMMGLVEQIRPLEVAVLFFKFRLDGEGGPFRLPACLKIYQMFSNFSLNL